MAQFSPDRRNAHHHFSEIARVTANALGSPWAFASACLTVLAWALAGPFFNYSETWQLYINTGTTIATRAS